MNATRKVCPQTKYCENCKKELHTSDLEDSPPDTFRVDPGWLVLQWDLDQLIEEPVLAWCSTSKVGWQPLTPSGLIMGNFALELPSGDYYVRYPFGLTTRDDAIAQLKRGACHRPSVR